MFSDPGDYVLGGQELLFRGTQQVGAWAPKDSGEASVFIRGRHNFSLEFDAPRGKRLKRGVYEDAQTPAVRPGGRPGIDISGDGYGCNKTTGRFEVRDIAFSRTGVPKRLWLIYEQHCEGSLVATFGEIRFKEPATKAGQFAPAVTRWPETDRLRNHAAVPISFIAPHSLRVKSVAVAGPKRSFPVRLDKCTRLQLRAGKRCVVWVQYLAVSAGTRTASLVVRDTQGNRYKSALQGFAWGGITRADLSSDQGDPIGLGQTGHYTLANALIVGFASRHRIRFPVFPGKGDFYDSFFSAAKGGTLTSGRTYHATRRPGWPGNGPGLAVQNQRGCDTVDGRFTIKELRLGRPDGIRTEPLARSLVISFVQHCDGASAALRGELYFRAGDHTKPAPWMR